MNSSPVEINAMWKLSGDDIIKAKEQLEEQRAALQAHYDSEVSRLGSELADIERVERFAANFASNHKEETPSIAAVEPVRSEEHTSELQSPCNLVCRLLLEKKKKKIQD